MMKTRVAAASVLSTLIAAVTPALAQDAGFGRTGQVILSAERLFGLSFKSYTIEDGTTGDKQTTSRTDISLLWPSMTVDTISPYTIPHLAADFVVISGLTVGGSVGFGRSTGTLKNEPVNAPTAERDADTITLFTFAPRIGYALAITPQIAFWPRAGVTYYSINAQGTNAVGVTRNDTIKGFGVNLEPMFVFSPVPHFGFTAGPVVDLPLSGSESVDRTPATTPNPPADKVRFRNWGLAVGVLGYF
jgi:hypothetical protein